MFINKKVKLSILGISFILIAILIILKSNDYIFSSSNIGNLNVITSGSNEYVDASVSINKLNIVLSKDMYVLPVIPDILDYTKKNDDTDFVLIKSKINNFFRFLDSSIKTINLAETYKYYDERVYKGIKDFSSISKIAYYVYYNYCKLANIDVENLDFDIYDELRQRDVNLTKLAFESDGITEDDLNITSNDSYLNFFDSDNPIKIIKATESDVQSNDKQSEYKKLFSKKNLLIISDGILDNIAFLLMKYYDGIVIINPKYNILSDTTINIENYLVDKDVDILDASDVLILMNFDSINTLNFCENLNTNFRIDEQVFFNSKSELFVEFYKDFYNYIINEKDGKSYLNKYGIKDLNDFYVYNSTWGGGIDGMGHVGDLLGKYFLSNTNEFSFDSQNGKKGFIAYCFENKQYVYFIKFLSKFFDCFRKTERASLLPKDQNGNFFHDRRSSVIDTAKFFYYNEQNIDNYMKSNKKLMKYFNRIPLCK